MSSGSIGIPPECPCMARKQCVREWDVQSALTLFCGGVAQTCHDDRVVELKEQLVVEEVDGEGQEGKGRRERSSQGERAMNMTVYDKVFAQDLSQ